MTQATGSTILEGMKAGTIVPYLGPGVLKGVVNALDNSPIPVESDDLILAMNNGQPMAPRLMYEFPRAAMHLENKKGRKFIEKFLQTTYLEKKWSESRFHTWLADQAFPYVIDTNRDMQLIENYASRPHVLVVGVARIAAHPYRFDIYQWQDGAYKEVSVETVDQSLPILFKPLGAPVPKASYIASDADFVDYITELMGGFAIPDWIKGVRTEKQYVFLGMHFTRDTERMIMSDMIYASKSDLAGWAFIANPNDKEKRFLERKNIEIIEQDWTALLEEEQTADVA